MKARLVLFAWLLAPLVAFAVAHGRVAGPIRAGTATWGYHLDVCDSHLLSDRLTADEMARLGACDTLYSHRLAYDTWTRVREAWLDRSSVGGFVVRDVWVAAVEARALNLADFALLLWPARWFLDAADVFAALPLALVGAAVLAGFAFAWALGASPAAAAASAIAVGTAGALTEPVLRGQYPQAMAVPVGLALFAGLGRLRDGERGGVALTAAGAALAALLYWQNALILGIGALVWVLVGGRGPGMVRGVAIAAGIAAIACLPAAWPVLDAIRGGGEEKLAMTPWGTPFSANPQDLAWQALYDEVPLGVLLHPTRAWALPILPLLPAAVLGLRGRRGAAWAALVIVGAVLAVGPRIALPDGWPGAVVPGFGQVPRVPNPLYELVYQWVPTASRMHHPLRWGLLCAVGLAGLVATGTDQMRRRWPDHAALAIAAALGWAALVGPWPLRRAPFPDLAAFDGCTELLYLSAADNQGEADDARRLDGLLWLPRFPLDNLASSGTAPPTAREQATSAAREAALQARLAGQAADLPPGTCVLARPEDIGASGPALRAAFGEPAGRLDGSVFQRGDGPPKTLDVYRVR